MSDNPSLKLFVVVRRLHNLMKLIIDYLAKTCWIVSKCCVDIQSKPPIISVVSFTPASALQYKKLKFKHFK